MDDVEIRRLSGTFLRDNSQHFGLMLQRSSSAR